MLRVLSFKFHKENIHEQKLKQKISENFPFKIPVLIMKK
jgi:hypothetical protein